MFWEGYGEITNFMHSWCKCKTLEKHQAVPQNGIGIELPYSPAIALPGTRGKSAHIRAKYGTRMSSAALFVPVPWLLVFSSHPAFGIFHLQTDIRLTSQHFGSDIYSFLCHNGSWTPLFSSFFMLCISPGKWKKLERQSYLASGSSSDKGWVL